MVPELLHRWPECNKSDLDEAMMAKDPKDIKKKKREKAAEQKKKKAAK